MKTAKKSSIRRASSWLALGLTLAKGAAWADPPDQVQPPPDYYTFQPPSAGGIYVDTVFGTSIKRISNARQTPNVADTGNLLFVTHEYSTMSPFNRDNTRLLIQHQSYYALYDGEGNFIKDLEQVGTYMEPRWSRVDREVLYYLYGNQLRQLNAVTGATLVVRTFQEYSSVSGGGESDTCFDGDHLALAGDGRYIFVYELSTGHKGPVLDAAGRGFDSLYVTPDDNVTVTWFERGTGRYTGIELFDRNMNFLRQVAQAGGHMDVTRDLNGDEVLVWSNAADSAAICVNGVVKVRLSDGQQTCLLSLDWSLAVHVSAPDDQGWVIVTTYSGADPDPQGPNWMPYTNEMLQVRLDGSQVRRLLHHRSRPFNGYLWTPRASVSWDGSRLVYSSNYGLQSILGYPPDYSDVYLAAVPSRLEERSMLWCDPCSWFTHEHKRLSGGSALVAMDAGALVTFRFTGTDVRWIGLRDEWSGIARVYLDGAFQGDLDLYASPAEWQAVSYSASGLPPGDHWLGIQVTGERNSESRGSWISIDAFEVEHGSSGFEEGDPAVRCDPCPWFSNQSPAHSKQRAITAADAGSLAAFRFLGTGVTWIGYRDEWSGIARVYVDGSFRGEVDTYASPAQAQAAIFAMTGLPWGTHTLVIEATGSKNPNSGGAWVSVDAFDTAP